MNECPKCNEALPYHVRFCSRCGTAATEVKKPKQCPCGFTAHPADNINFCPDCGRSMRNNK